MGDRLASVKSRLVLPFWYRLTRAVPENECACVTLCVLVSIVVLQRALSREEASFPLAFSIAMYTDVEQTERLLRSIYHPHNLYCIHVDTKSSLLVHRTVTAIARCFHNVWVATHLDKIKWGDVRSAV